MSATSKTVTRDTAFKVLDSVESALIDLQCTTDTFRALCDATVGSTSTETDTMLRHIESDLSTLRAAFDKAHKAILGGLRGNGEPRHVAKETDNVVPLTRPEPEGGAA